MYNNIILLVCYWWKYYSSTQSVQIESLMNLLARVKMRSLIMPDSYWSCPLYVDVALLLYLNDAAYLNLSEICIYAQNACIKIKEAMPFMSIFSPTEYCFRHEMDINILYRYQNILYKIVKIGIARHVQIYHYVCFVWCLDLVMQWCCWYGNRAKCYHFGYLCLHIFMQC